MGFRTLKGTRAMDRLRLTTAIAFGTLLVLQGAALAQEPGIGSAKTARNKVEGVVGGQTQDVKTGSQVYPTKQSAPAILRSRIWSSLIIPI